MRSLGYITHELGNVLPTAKVELATGREFYLCNVFAEIVEAMAAGLPFEAHSVIGMNPVEVIVNPAHVATVEAVES